eukprot:scaffold26864_cov63-Attheya_sp.AAC.2
MPNLEELRKLLRLVSDINVALLQVTNWRTPNDESNDEEPRGSRRELFDHLHKDHQPQEIKCLNTNTLLLHDIHRCPNCKQKLFLSQPALMAHTKQTCSQAKATPRQPNLAMALTTFATSNPGSDGWQEALQHFTDPNKEIPPMPVRRAIFDKTNHRLCTQLYDVYAKLMHLTADSLEPSDHPDNCQSTSTPFIIISILFPILILAPLEKGHKDSVASRIHARPYTTKQWPSSDRHHWRNASEQTTQQQKQPRQLKAWRMRAT